MGVTWSREDGSEGRCAALEAQVAQLRAEVTHAWVKQLEECLVHPKRTQKTRSTQRRAEERYGGKEMLLCDGGHALKYKGYGMPLTCVACTAVGQKGDDMHWYTCKECSFSTCATCRADPWSIAAPGSLWGSSGESGGSIILCTTSPVPKHTVSRVARGLREYQRAVEKRGCCVALHSLAIMQGGADKLPFPPVPTDCTRVLRSAAHTLCAQYPTGAPLFAMAVSRSGKVFTGDALCYLSRGEALFPRPPSL
eukprot:Sspe_Gene.110790::Locus_91864_Transcript_1_1_Confidence_1.000_Length_808::g.110790::m.110790